MKENGGGAYRRRHTVISATTSVSIRETMRKKTSCNGQMSSPMKQAN